MQLPRHPQASQRVLACALTVSLAALASGCLGPNAEETRPEQQELLRGQVRESWSSAAEEGNYADSVTVKDGVAEPFWATFNEPVLNGLVVEALQHNHDLVASAQRLRGAAARSQLVRAGRLPQLDAGATYARQKNLFVGLPIPGTDGPASAIFNQWNAGLSVAWELDLWGKISAAVDAADFEVAASFAELQGARLSIAAQVTHAWFELRAAAQLLELAERTSVTYEESAQVVRDRFDAGLSGALDLRLAEANVAGSAANVSAAERAYRVASRQIEILLGRFPAAELESQGEFGAMPPSVPAGVPADVLSRRPDLVAAEHRVSAAESLARAARLDRWPSMALTSSGGRTSDMFDDLLDGDFSIWSIAGSVTAPLFDGGRRRAEVDASLAEMHAARAQFSSMALNAFFEVESTLDAELMIRERLGYLETAVTASVEATSLSDAQYREGLVSIELVLESQRRQLLAEAEYLTARRELYQARVDLHVALGGNFVVQSEDPVAESDLGAASDAPEVDSSL